MYYIYKSSYCQKLKQAKNVELDWIWPIVVRNLLGCWIICGFWDWFLYLSPFQRKLTKFKVCLFISLYYILQ